MEVVITDLFESVQTITVSIFHSVNMGITGVKHGWRNNKHLSLGKKPEEWTTFPRLSASHLVMCSPRSVRWWGGLNSANQSVCRLDSLFSFSLFLSFVHVSCQVCNNRITTNNCRPSCFNKGYSGQLKMGMGAFARHGRTLYLVSNACIEIYFDNILSYMASHFFCRDQYLKLS